jgi:hypothetical protein
MDWVSVSLHPGVISSPLWKHTLPLSVGRTRSVRRLGVTRNATFEFDVCLWTLYFLCRWIFAKGKEQNGGPSSWSGSIYYSSSSLIVGSLSLNTTTTTTSYYIDYHAVLWLCRTDGCFDIFASTTRNTRGRLYTLPVLSIRTLQYRNHIYIYIAHSRSTVYNIQKY